MIGSQLAAPRRNIPGIRSFKKKAHQRDFGTVISWRRFSTHSSTAREIKLGGYFLPR
jgi:hypothetical protein